LPPALASSCTRSTLGSRTVDSQGDLDLHRVTPFDVIHAHFIYPEGVIASRIGAELGVQVVSSEHAMWRPWLDRHASVRRTGRACAAPNRADHRVSEALRGSILGLFGDAVPVDVIPNVSTSESSLRLVQMSHAIRTTCSSSASFAT
jgi:hypothetical protein